MPIFDALMLDKLYKTGAISDQQKERIGEEKYAEMLAFCDDKREKMRYLYGIADDISKFEQ